MRNLALMWVLAGCLLGCGGKDKDAKDKAVSAVNTVAITPDTYTTFTDTRDGKVYKIVRIGRQYWFAENLNYAAEGSKCYGEGGKVAMVKDRGRNYVTLPKTLSPDEVQTNCAKYGRLYRWETALTACPAGFHLPLDKEWTTLMDNVGGEDIAGTKLKSEEGWNECGNGTNEYGFSALPGGIGIFNQFVNAGNFGHWWSATGEGTFYAFGRATLDNIECVFRFCDVKAYQFSVRCVRD